MLVTATSRVIHGSHVEAGGPRHAAAPPSMPPSQVLGTSRSRRRREIMSNSRARRSARYPRTISGVIGGGKPMIPASMPCRLHLGPGDVESEMHCFGMRHRSSHRAWADRSYSCSALTMWPLFRGSTGGADLACLAGSAPDPRPARFCSNCNQRLAIRQPACGDALRSRDRTICSITRGRPCWGPASNAGLLCARRIFT